MKTLIATPCLADQVHRLYMLSLLTQTFNSSERLKNQDHYDLSLYTAGGVSGLGKDRGLMASYAVRHNYDKIFFIDSDQSWNWDQFRKIVDSDKPITCGVVALKKYPLQLNFTPLLDDAEGVATPGILKWLTKKYESNIIPVKLCGTAFMSIDVLALKKMVTLGIAPPFAHKNEQGQNVECWDFFQSGCVGGVYIGEDWGFCAQAAHAGFTTYIDASVLVDHHGAHTYRIGQELLNV